MKLMRFILLAGFILLFSRGVAGQHFSFNCTKDTLIAGCLPAPCNITLRGIIPDLRRGGTNYAVNPTSVDVPGCFPVYLAPNDPGGTSSNLTIDDRYTGVINIGFPFQFYGTAYNTLVASTNGYVSFDASRAGLGSHWSIGANLPSATYDRALIMGPYHDLDPSVTTSPTRRIQYQVWGVAPHRRWILSFYRVPLFGGACNGSFENTHQIILYESTGLIEVAIMSKQFCTSWNAGKAVVGIQDFNRTQGLMPPGRAASSPPWGTVGMNESWRFVPTGGTSLLKRVELLSMGGAVLSTGTTAPAGSGLLEATFPNLCPPAGVTTSYIIRSVYEKIDDPAVEILGMDTIRVNRGSGLTANATSTAGSCSVNNGTITVGTVSGGTAPYQYSINGGAWQNSNLFTGLSQGTHTVIVRDASGLCTVTLTVVVAQQSLFLPTAATATPITCSGLTDGSITVTATGGIGPYLVTLTGPTPYSGTVPLPFTIPNLTPGSYTVTVTDQGSGCLSQPITGVSIGVGPGVTGELVSTTPASCLFATNGTATVRATSGTGPFTFQLNGNAPFAANSPHTFTGLTGGPGNSVIIRDALGCVSNLIPITIPAGNNSSTATATASCGAASGTITVTPVGGIAPYSYSIDGGLTWQSSNVFTGLAPGNYTIRVQHGDPVCLSIATATVTSAPPLTGTIASTNITPCGGATNGTITLTPTSGTAPYTFSSDGVTWLPGTSPYTFTNLAAGSYTVYFRDNSGCQFSQPVVLTEPAPITATTTFTPTTCNGATNGSITVTVTGGATGIMGFSLDGGPVINNTSPAVFPNLSSTTHTIRITNLSTGCTSGLISVFIPQGPVFTIPPPVATPASCPGATDGTITVTAAGGGTFLFSLNGTNNQTSPSPYVFTGVSPGTHTITVTNNASCTSSVMTVTVPAGPGIVATAVSTNADCGAPTGSITVNPPTGGTPPYQYSLDGITWQSSNIFPSLGGGNYTVRVRGVSVICVTSIPVTILQNSGVSAPAPISTLATCGGANGTITVNGATGGTPPYQYSLDGITWQAGATFPGLAAGTYTVRVRDAGATVCSATISNVTVGSTSAVTTTGTTTAIATCGSSNGSIMVNPPTGGTPPYQYSLDGITWQAGTTFPGLSPGTYTVRVRDAGATVCSATIANVTVGSTSAVTAAGATTALATCGSSNGSITVNLPSGGTAPYQYSLDGITWQAGATFPGLAAGTYTVRVRDAGATVCSTTIANVNVGSTSAVTAAGTTTAQATCGSSNGSITVNLPSGGTAPYQYSLDGITWQAGATFPGLAAGTYTVRVRDAGATVCSTTIANVNVGSTSAVTAAGTTTAQATCGSSNGSITVNAPSGGTPPYQYSLDGITWQAGATFPGLAAGTYTVRVRDAGATVCSATIANVTVGSTSAVTTTGTTTAIATCGSSNGSITVNLPSGGTAPYQYSLDGITWQAGATFSGLAAGTYTVRVRDAGATVCSATIANVTVGQTSAVTAAGATTAIAACGSSNGSITVNLPSGGTAPYQYSLDGITWQPGTNFPGLAAGNYTVRIRDAGATVCSTSFSVTVGQTSAVSAPQPTLSNATCGGANGTITINGATGGTAPYEYSLDGISWQTGNIFTGLAGGNYTAWIRDASALCSTLLPVTLGSTSAVTTTGTTTAIATCGSSNGSITVNLPSGGTAPYQYSLDGITWQAGATFPGLAAGTYTVRVRDAGATVCSTTIANVNVGSTSAVTAAGTTTAQATCGSSNGSITVNLPSGGTAPYQYSLDGITWQPGATFSGLAAGTYTVTIRDAGATACSATIPNVTVGSTSAVVTTGTTTAIATCGSSNGSIMVNPPTGGTPPYQYSLDGITWQAGTTFPGLSPGTYTVRVRDAGATVCSATIANVTVGSTSAVTTTGTTTAIATCGSSNGSITVNLPSGGTAPYQYSLDGITWQAGATFSGLAAGTYTVRVRDAGATVCSTTIANVSVGSTSAVTAAGTTTAQATCGSSNGSITVNVPSGGTAPYQYSLDGITWQAGTTFSGLAAGTYTVTIRDAGATACSATITNVTVGSTSAVTTTGTTTAIATCGSSNGSITVNPPTGGTAPYQYSLDGITWQPGASFTGLAAGNYTVRVRDAGAVVCSTTLSATIGQTSAVLAPAPTSTVATCGGANGTITVNGVTGGTAPYEYSLDGITWQSGNTFTGLAAGNYTVRVRDAGAVVCSTTLSATIGQTSAVSAPAPTSTVATCGTANGTITVTGVTGGTAPYDYSLDGITWQSGNNFTGLAAGNYTVRVRDAGTVVCTTTLLVTVGQTSAVSAPAPTSTVATCGGANGTITVNGATGGTPPYEYSLDGISWQTGNTFTSLTGGNYTAWIRDASALCSTTLPVTVAQTAAVSAVTTIVPTSCGTSTGSITVSITTGGNPPYAYSLNGITWQAGNLFSGLAAGTYTVTVRDNGAVCNTSVLVTVPQTGSLAATTSSSAASCAGINNGSITISTAGGTGPYTFSLDGGAAQPGVLPFTFTNISAGSHTVLVTDLSAGCTSNTITVTVAAGPGVTATASSTATTCPVAANGTITATATAGIAPFTFQLDAGVPQNGASPFTFNNVPAGAHTVIIRDNAGCNSTITVNVAPGPAVTASAASTATACTGVSTGTITVTPVTGTLPFTYSLDGAAAIPGAAPYTFVNVAAGTHTITVTDAAGCVSNVISVVVPVGPGVNGTASAIATSCPGVPNGSVIVTSLAGTAPFTYQLDGGAFQSGASPYTFSNVTAGAHTVVIRDNTGCTQTLNVSVSVGPPLTTTVSKTDALCNGGASGSITVTQPVTGTAPYQYSLDGTTWQAGNSFPGLTAGTYTAYYRESNGCQGSQTITVNEPTAIAATANAVAAICNGQNNGSITITASGGSLPYQYSLNGGTSWQNSNVFTVAAGSYTISIRDLNNCITTQTVTVTQPPVLSASSVNTAASCNGGNDGIINVTAAGGNAGYQYSLDGVTFQSQNTFNVGPGNYTVTVKDNLGCTTSIAAIVTVGSDFTLVPQADATICEGRSAQLQLTSNATQYAWTPATGLSSTTIANPVANPAVTTQYIVTATYGRCSGTDTVIVNVNRAPVPNAGADVTVCSGQTYQLQGSGGTVYSWTPNTYLNNSSIPNPVVTPTRSITYSLSIVSDANGCASLVSDQVLVNVNPPITVKTFPYDTIGYTGNQIQLLAVSSDSATNNYSWSPGNGLSSTTIPNPVATVGAVIGDVIRYQVIATNAAGCRGEGYITIRVYKGPDIYVPTGFTPNGDGRNDRLLPVPVGIKSYNYFNVFNRWGQMVFSTKKMHDGWDGKLLLKDQPSGVYVWMIEGVTNDGRVISKQGTVALIR